MHTMPDFQVLTLEGSPRERGQIHGEALKPKILEFLGGWKEGLGKATGMNPKKYLEQFVEETGFLAAVERWAPDLLEEVRGIADGCGVDSKTIFANQLADEEWWYRREKKLRPASREPKSCSGLGIFGQEDGRPLLAQNMDVPDCYDGYQVLLHVKDPASPVESFVFTAAGFIALNGLNNRSVGICCNTLAQLNHATDGLPVAFIVRTVLAQSSQKDAIDFIHRIKHASGQNYIIGGPQEILDFECSAGKVRQFAPNPGATRVYHTNHPLVNDDQEMFGEMLKKLSPEQRHRMDAGQTNSRARFDFLENQLSDISEAITVEKIKAILSSHQVPVCRDRKKGRGLTLGCSIVELSSPPVLHLAPGPPCSTAFHRFTF